MIEEHRPTNRGHKQRLELSRRQDDGDVERRRNVVVAVISGDSRTERIDVQAGQQQRDSRAADEQPRDDPHIRTVAQALFGRRAPWGQMSRARRRDGRSSPHRSSWHAHTSGRNPNSVCPARTSAPRAQQIVVTVPATGATTGVSIFMVSRMIRRSPAATCAPGATAISQTLPVIAARIGDGVGRQRLALPDAVGRGIRLLGRRRQRGPARALLGEGRPLLEAKGLDRRRVLVEKGPVLGEPEGGLLDLEADVAAREGGAELQQLALADRREADLIEEAQQPAACRPETPPSRGSGSTSGRSAPRTGSRPGPPCRRRRDRRRRFRRRSRASRCGRGCTWSSPAGGAGSSGVATGAPR